MRLAIVSDIHDNLPALRRALARLDGAACLLCLGDLCSPFVVKELADGFAGPIHVVFGNNDGDRFRITENARRYPHVTIHGEFADLALGGRRVALHHFDDVGRALARSDAYDVVCFGHNHRFELSHDGGTRIVNPGEIYGGLSGVSTFVLLDLDTDEALRVDV